MCGIPDTTFMYPNSKTIGLLLIEYRYYPGRGSFYTQYGGTARYTDGHVENGNSIE